MMDLDGLEIIAEKATPTRTGRREVYLAPVSIRELKADPRLVHVVSYHPARTAADYVFSIADIDVFKL